MFKCQTIDKDDNKNRKDDKGNERDLAKNSRNCNGMYACLLYTSDAADE